LPPGEPPDRIKALFIYNPKTGAPHAAAVPSGTNAWASARDVAMIS